MNACPLHEADLDAKNYTKWIHVREVVPIDWDKVWEAYDKAHRTLGFAPLRKMKLIEQLVEKALKGEL